MGLVQLLILFTTASRLSAQNTSYCTDKGNLPIFGTTAKNNGTFESAEVEMLVGKGDTVCYNLVTEKDGTALTGRRVFVSFLGVDEQYTIDSIYSFSVPDVNVGCRCKCDPSAKSCDDFSADLMCKLIGLDTCVVLPEGNSSMAVCPLRKVREKCCFVSLHSTRKEPEYTAFSISHPRTVIRLAIGLGDNNLTIIGDDNVKIVTVDTASSSVATGLGNLRVTIHATESYSLTEKWYFFDSDGLLKSGVAMNDPHENDLQKLGWFRFDASRKLQSPTAAVEAIRNSMSASVLHCTLVVNTSTWTFNASFYNKIDTPGRISFGKVVRNDTIRLQNGAKAIQIRSNISSVTIRYALKVSSKDFFRSTKSVMKDFTAEIVQHSSHLSTLELVISKASGFFLGTIYDNTQSEKEPFEVGVVSAYPVDSYKTTFQLLSMYHCPTEVCLYYNAMEKGYRSHCVNAKCKMPSGRLLYFFFVVGGVVSGVILLGFVIVCYVRKNGSSNIFHKSLKMLGQRHKTEPIYASVIYDKIRCRIRENPPEIPSRRDAIVQARDNSSNNTVESADYLKLSDCATHDYMEILPEFDQCPRTPSLPDTSEGVIDSGGYLQPKQCLKPHYTGIIPREDERHQTEPYDSHASSVEDEEDSDGYLKPRQQSITQYSLVKDHDSDYDADVCAGNEPYDLQSSTDEDDTIGELNPR